jgi:hypothetical protein
MTVHEIATLTGYTLRMIQLECQQGRLKATKRRGWTIAHADYIVWRSSFQAWRKPYKRVQP